MSGTIFTDLSNVLSFAADGRWMGCDYVLALVAATFPAWTLVTLVRGWVCGWGGPAPVRVAVTPRPRRGSDAAVRGGEA